MTIHNEPIGGLGRTGFIIAAFREMEALREEPLFSDPYAQYFLNDDMRAAALKIAEEVPASQGMVRFRTLYIDRMLQEHLERGFQQVLILGSGLDSRSIRFKQDGVKFYEVDQKTVIKFKKERLAQAGIPFDSICAGMNYFEGNAAEALIKMGFNPTLKTFVIWEGNTPYSTAEQNKSVLAHLNKTITGEVKVTFDYITPAVVTRTTGVHQLTRAAEIFEQNGSKWITGYHNAHELIAELPRYKVFGDQATSRLDPASLAPEEKEAMDHYYVGTAGCLSQ